MMGSTKLVTKRDADIVKQISLINHHNQRMSLFAPQDLYCIPIFFLRPSSRRNEIRDSTRFGNGARLSFENGD